MFKILINKKEYSYDSLKFTEKFNSLANQLGVQFAGNYNFSLSDKIILKYENEILLNGFIDEIVVNKTEQNISTSISCRDITSDIIDSKMRVITRKKNYNFLTLLKELTSLEVVNKSNVANFTIPYPLKSNLGQDFSEFLQDIAKYFKVFLSCSSDGKILITSLNVDKKNIFSIKNYTNYTKTQNITELYNRYTCYSQTKLAATEPLRAQITDNTIRNTRFYVFESDSILNSTKEALNLASRQKQLNKAKSQYIDISALFDNKIYHVNSFVEFEKNIYFLNEISYNISSSNKTIDFKLVERDVYL